MCLDKKITIASALLLIMAIPLVFSVTLLTRQKFIQYQRDQKFKTEILQTITVSSDNIFWIKPGKEIYVDGKLFDVKSFEVEGNNISLTGFFDHKETHVVQHIVKLALEKNSQDDTAGKAPGIQFLFFPVCINTQEIHLEESWRFLENRFYSFDESLPAALHYPLIHPPRHVAG